MRALESVLAQSYPRLEAIVVVDGLEPETMQILESFNDDRLRLIMLDENVGGSEARNIGVRAANGEWVAFLDDDDQWMTDKLRLQMDKTADLRAENPVLSSRLIARDSDTERVLPQCLYVSGENMADYLFCRRGFAYGEGMLQTSTLLTKRNLLLEIPFQKGLKRHQDWDWLLKVAGRSDVEIVMLPEALTLMYIAGQSKRVSQAPDWSPSLEWAKRVRPLMSARAYSFFITTECLSRARKCYAGVGAITRLLWEAVWNGKPGLRQMALFLCFSVIPENIYRELRIRTIRGASTVRYGGCNQA